MLKGLLFSLTLCCLTCVCFAQSETPPAEPPPSEPPPTVPPHPRPSSPTPVGTYPFPVSNPYRWRFTLAAPSPALFQSRDENRPKRMELQFPFAVFGGLGEKKGWGHFFLASDNVISTDAFDSSARIGLRLGVEHPLYPPGPLITTEIGIAANQRGQNQALGATYGTRFFLPIALRTGKPTLQINFLGYENRRRLNIASSPQHTAHDALVSSATLELPPICLGKQDPKMRPYFQFRTRAWYFLHEAAAPGFTPRHFERRYEYALIVPSRTVGKRTPFVKAVALSYIVGANDANAYASQRNFRINFILVDTRRLLDEMTEHGMLPKMPKVKLPTVFGPKDKDNKSEGAPSSGTTTGGENSSTTPENTGKPPEYR